MYNLRYHIASLVAVFLSLAIGLLLGTIVVERGTLDRQRDSIVKALQDEFRTIADDNDALRTENEELLAYSKAALGPAIAGQLAGRTVAVLSDPQRGDAAELVAASIRAAGGVPVAVTLQLPTFGFEEPSASDVETSAVETTTPDAFVSSVVASLATEWTAPGSDRPLTETLVSAGAFDIEDLDSSTVISGVVVLAAWDGSPDQAALALAARIAETGGVGVAAETRADATGVARAADETGLSAVDNIDDVSGQFSLVYLLAGRADGYYGVGDGTDGRYPEITLE